jgi:hemolysin III
MFGACVVYVISLVGLFGASTLSHAVRQPAWRSRLRALDQGFIYLLIAGNYTPYALAYLPQGWWSLLSAAIWGTALAGFVSKVVLSHRVEAVSVPFYMLLGWMPAIGMLSMRDVLPAGCLFCIAGGAVCYCAGTVFLVRDTRRRYFHSIWHLLVIGGSTCHFLGVLLYIVPQS